MHAELKEKFYPYRSIDVHTDEGCFNVRYQRRDPDSEYVSVQGKTVVHAKGGSLSKLTFAVGSLPAALEVRRTSFRRLSALTLTVDNQAIYSENWFKLLLPEGWRRILFMGCWYLGICSIIGFFLMLVVLACRWVLGSVRDFQLDLRIPLGVAIAFAVFLWLDTVIRIAKGAHRVTPNLLIRKIDNPDEIRFERMRDEWEQFRSAMVEGDEIWEWETPEWTWRLMAGRCGYVIVHQGHPTSHILVTGMN